MAAPARAADSDDKRSRARTLLIEGGKFLETGQYGEALAKFEAAFALVPSPKIQYNFGLCYVGMERPSEALRAFEIFLVDAPDAPAANLAQAREYLGRLSKKVAVLNFQGELAGAEESVDGRSYGAAGHVFVDPGPHLVSVERPGTPPFIQKVSVAAGEKVSIPVRFAAAQAAPTKESPPATLVLPPPPPPRPAPEPGARTWQRPVAWASAGVGGALAIGGTAFLLISDSKYKQFNAVTDAMTTNMHCTRALPSAGGPRCASLLADGKQFNHLGIGALVGAGVFGAAAAVLFVTAPPSSGEKVSLACAPTLGGALCQVRFR